jgi:parallel beta-helix repeat protein
MAKVPQKIGASETTVTLSAALRYWRYLLITGMAIAAIGCISLLGIYLYLDRTPGELIRYAERRLAGHPKLELFSVPLFALLRPMVERPVLEPVPKTGKGHQKIPMAPQAYNHDGNPLSGTISQHFPPALYPTRLLSNEKEIQEAILQARPGDVLEIVPGEYRVNGKLTLLNGGVAANPIILRAQQPGTVNLLFNSAVGLEVSAPYWIVENLVIRGICEPQGNCEHAFHIFGKARATVIRNNLIEDFNAHIKVNGFGNFWPDDGLIQFNTLNNTSVRETANPVTLIDIVGTSRWIAADNVISNFIKGNGNYTSYGAFMKGGGSDGRFERNLVICTEADISQKGVRIGLSFGNGGTGTQFCRDRRCITEHSRGVIADNMVMHCNDFGIYINKSNGTIISGNKLNNNYGIDIRYPESSATLERNIVDGKIRERDGGRIINTHN